MKILVFLQGTILMHKNAAGKAREEIIQQVADQEDSVRDFENYIPIGNAAEKLQVWAAQGVEICYVSSLTENKKARGDELVGKEGLAADAEVLVRHHFPKGAVYHRDAGEEYVDVIERIKPFPNIFIEDNCESIGGEREMTYTHLRLEVQQRIKSIVVPEFGGIDHLPDKVDSLMS